MSGKLGVRTGGFIDARNVASAGLLPRLNRLSVSHPRIRHPGRKAHVVSRNRERAAIGDNARNARTEAAREDKARDFTDEEKGMRQSSAVNGVPMRVESCAASARMSRFARQVPKSLKRCAMVGGRLA